MALTLGTDTLCELARANTYNGAHPFGAAWDLHATGHKENLLRLATMLFTQLVQWCGSPTDEDQALPFPRKGLRTRNGAEVGSSTVPELAQDATAELARRLGDADTTPNQVLRDLDILKAGDVSFGGGALRKVIPDAVMDMYPGPAKGGGGYGFGSYGSGTGGGLGYYGGGISDYGDCWYYYVEGGGHISARSPSYY